MRGRGISLVLYSLGFLGYVFSMMTIVALRFVLQDRRVLASAIVCIFERVCENTVIDI